MNLYYLIFCGFLLKGCNSFTQNSSTSVLNNEFLNMSQRAPKWIPIVSYVRFENKECVADDLRNGTCYNYHECKKLQGTPIGKCASNLGTCCVFQYSCGQTVLADNSHFINPSYPAKDGKLPEPCYLTITIPTGTCQVLLWMKEFNISQPEHDTVCRTDKMWVSRHPEIPTICGSNQDQHMYIDVDGKKELKLVINSKGTKFQRIWNIKISLLSCKSTNLAPVGCLQYVAQTSGTIKSFNFYELKEFNYEYEDYEYYDPPCTTHLANQNYGICVQKAQGMCQIEWTATTFEITGNESYAIAQRGDICQKDYVMIPNGRTIADMITFDRYCGFALNTAGSTTSASVTSDALPFMIRFVANGDEDIGEVTRGFNLQFRQISCDDC